MHPHSVSTRSSVDAAKGSSHDTAAQQTQGRSHLGTAAVATEKTPSRYPLVSPRPRVSRASGTVIRKSGDSRQGTPLSSRAVKPAAAASATPRKGSLQSTPMRRSTNGSATRAAREGTPQTHAARPTTKGVTSARVVSGRAAARRRSTSLTRPPSSRTSNKANHHNAIVTGASTARRVTPEKVIGASAPAAMTSRGSATTTPYRAPPTPTAPPLAVKPRAARPTASRQSSLSKKEGEKEEKAVGRRSSVTEVAGPMAAAAAVRKGHGNGKHDDLPADANEPFAETIHFKCSIEQGDDNAPFSNLTAPAQTGAATAAAPRRAMKARTAEAVRNTTKSLPCTAVSHHPDLPATRTYLSMRATRLDNDPSATEALIQSLLTTQPGDSRGRGAEANTKPAPSVVTPQHLYQLPRCSEGERRRLFHALTNTTDGSSRLWSLHTHILPFLAAHSAAILPVTAEQLLAYLGDAEATTFLAQAHAAQAVPATRAPAVSPNSLARFAAELGGWFFYTGVLQGSEALTWTSALGGPSALPITEVDAASPHLSGNTRAYSNKNNNTSVLTATAGQLPQQQQQQQRYESVSSNLSVTPEVQQHHEEGAGASRSSRSTSPSTSVNTSPTALPRVLPRRGTKAARSSHAAGGAADASASESDEDKAGTVRWRTTRFERSLAAASSTFASVDFRAVVDAPPYVEEAAFVRGYEVVRQLLEGRAAALIEGNGQCGNFVLRLCTALRTVDARTGGDESSAPSARLPSRVPSAVRAGLRRVRFYIRLHAFLRQLHLYHRANAVTPSMREAQLVASVVQSRLMAGLAAGTTDVQHDAKVLRQKPSNREKSALPRACGWLGRSLLHRNLHNAIMRTSPSSVHHTHDPDSYHRHSSSSSNNTSGNVSAVDTLDILLTLRSREAEQMVCSVEATHGISTRRKLDCKVTLSALQDDKTAKVVDGGEGRAAVTAAAAPYHTLPVSLLLLFSLPRWTPWQCCVPSTPTDSATRSTAAAFGEGYGVPLCLFAAAFAVTFLFAPLLYFAVRCLEPDWLPWWDAAAPPLDTSFLHFSLFGDAHFAAVRLEALYRSLNQLLLSIPVLLLMSYLGAQRGATAARVAVQHALTQSQAKRLTLFSSAWLYSAWALRKENTVAAAAAKRCLARLALVCRAAEASDTATQNRSAYFSPFVICATLLSLLVATVHAAVAPQRKRVWMVWHLTLITAVAWRSVRQAWWHRLRVLDWWLQRQACLAEGFAWEVLRERSFAVGDAVEVTYAEGQCTLTPVSSSSLQRTPAALHVVSLPLLAELTKVAYVVQCCQKLQFQDTDSSMHCPASFTPCSVRLLEDFPMQCFWEQLCGHSAVAYASDTAAITVVERAAAACAEAAAALRKSKSLTETLSVERILALLLPWAMETSSNDVRSIRSCGTFSESMLHLSVAAEARESGEEAKLMEVLAPVAATTTSWCVDAVHSTQGPSSPSTPERRGLSFAEQPMPFDVQLRRCPYLTPPQRRLLVCAAVVFTCFGMAPPPSTAVYVSGKAGQTDDAQTCVTESALVCLVRLVWAQLDSGGVEDTAAGRWREAERRTRNAVRLVQHATITTRLQGGRGNGVDGNEESCFSLLPQLNHVLFRC